MKSRDIAIVGYYETKFERRSGRSVFDVAGEAASGALANAGIKKSEVDGVAVNSTLSGAGEPFFSNRVCDALGLVPRWLEMSDIGGPTGIGNVARAASAIRDGWCSTALVMSADTPSTTWGVRYGSYRPEFQEPYGVQGPPGLFGLLQRRYAEQYPLDVEALAKIAMVQREHALLNPNAIFKQPMSREDYSYTVTRLPPEGFEGREPYVLVAVDLPEGVRMLGTLLDVPPETVRIGMPVRASYERLTDDITLVQFVAG